MNDDRLANLADSMTRSLSAIFATLATLLLVPIWVPVHAAVPPAVNCLASAFTAPNPGAVVAGAVEIRGRAVVPDFQFYKIEYAPVGRDNWVLIGQTVNLNPMPQEGRLVIWQTTNVPDGAYRLRMHAVDVTGNYCEIILQPIVVSNAQPIAAPTATVTETPALTEAPVLTAVPIFPTATLRPRVITDVLPVQRTPLPAEENRRGLELPDINFVAYVAIFGLGACGMGAVVAVIFVTTRILNRRS